MPRVKGGPRAHAKHRKIIKMAKGYRGSRNSLFSRANQAVIRAGEHQFAGRKQRRRDIRRLWILRLNNALDKYGIKYSKFINAQGKANITLNRKMLSEMAIHDTAGFEAVVTEVKKAL